MTTYCTVGLSCHRRTRYLWRRGRNQGEFTVGCFLMCFIFGMTAGCSHHHSARGYSANSLWKQSCLSSPWKKQNTLHFYPRPRQNLNLTRCGPSCFSLNSPSKIRALNAFFFKTTLYCFFDQKKKCFFLFCFFWLLSHNIYSSKISDFQILTKTKKPVAAEINSSRATQINGEKQSSFCLFFWPLGLFLPCWRNWSLAVWRSFPSLFSLMSSSSEVRFEFIVSVYGPGWVSKVQSGCLDRLLEEQGTREGPQDLCALRFGTHFFGLVAS